MEHRKKVSYSVQVFFHLFVSIFVPMGTLLLVIAHLLAWPVKRIRRIADDLFRSIVTNMPPPIRAHFKYFDLFGLRHSIHHLKGILWQQMLNWDMEQMLEYADEHTIKGCRPSMRLRFFKWAAKRSGIQYAEVYAIETGGYTLVQQVQDYFKDNLLNATVIGNLAYIAAYSPDNDRREDAYHGLCWLREKMGITKSD